MNDKYDLLTDFASSVDYSNFSLNYKQLGAALREILEKDLTVRKTLAELDNLRRIYSLKTD